jgi:L-ascorbate metabolism protein UlaG (beta-lactamase superfamily)
MRKSYLLVGLLLLTVFVLVHHDIAHATRTDTLPTTTGELRITLIGHASLMFEHNGKIIHVDPWSKMGDYTKMPKADLILITHHHRDHLDFSALEQIITERTAVVLTPICAEKMSGQIRNPTVMANGEVKTTLGLKIEAVPAYNLVHMRSSGQPYHPKGEGNGYVITFGDKRVYVAGDTENTPEMKSLRNIDVAFLPMNLPYTMDSAMAADAAKAFKPKILYPYHTLFSEDQVSGFVELMKGTDGIKIRVSE